MVCILGARERVSGKDAEETSVESRFERYKVGGPRCVKYGKYHEAMIKPNVESSRVKLSGYGTDLRQTTIPYIYTSIFYYLYISC